MAARLVPTAVRRQAPSAGPAVVAGGATTTVALATTPGAESRGPAMLASILVTVLVLFGSAAVVLWSRRSLDGAAMSVRLVRVDEDDDLDSTDTAEPSGARRRRGSRPGPVRRRPEPGTRPRRSRVPLPAVAVAVWVLGGVAALAAWLLVFMLGVSALQEAGDQNRLYGQLREELALGTAPLGGTIEPGTPVALVDAPAADLTRVVAVEGTTAADLQSGPGHLRSSPLPGQPGVSVLLGRAVTYGGPFRSLGRLRPGDTITVTTGQGVFAYVVDDVRRSGDKVPAPPAAGGSRLVLVSLAGAGRGTPVGHDRHGVRGRDAARQDRRLLRPAVRSGLLPQELPGHGDAQAWVPLVLWLQALVLLVALVVWVRVRWGGRQAWVVGLPLLALVLWLATDSASQLFPNLL